MAGDDDGRDQAALIAQPAQQLEPGHVRHADVGDKAAALRFGKAVEKGGRRFVDTHGKSGGV